MRRYRKYIEAPTYSADEITAGVREWINTWKDDKDPRFALPCKMSGWMSEKKPE